MKLEKKHSLYERSVQNPSSDIDFINDKFKELTGRNPLTIREDFGGTGYLCCLWSKQSKKHEAFVIDLDDEPMDYGKANHYSKLNKEQQSRVKYIKDNVLNTKISTDVVVAFNFSYFIFKERNVLVDYFKRVRKSMKKDGVFFLDLFGGSECYSPIEEETDHGKFTYFWDLESYNPITNEVLYYIHFQEKGKAKKRCVFTYDWRMWSLPEIRDCLHDAGFKDTVIFWEGDDDDGGGNGEFYPSEKEEQCDSWVIYIAAYN